MGLDICRIHLCSNSESLNRPVCVAVASNDPNSISYSEYRLGDSLKIEERYSECVGRRRRSGSSRSDG